MKGKTPMYVLAGAMLAAVGTAILIVLAAG